jgi:hypothetical protein
MRKADNIAGKSYAYIIASPGDEDLNNRAKQAADQWKNPAGTVKRKD